MSHTWRVRNTIYMFLHRCYSFLIITYLTVMHLCQTPIMHDMYITINNMDNYNLIDSYHNTTWINADVDDQNFFTKWLLSKYFISYYNYAKFEHQDILLKYQYWHYLTNNLEEILSLEWKILSSVHCWVSLL